MGQPTWRNSHLHPPSQASMSMPSVLTNAINKDPKWKRLDCCRSEGDYLRQTVANLHPNVSAQVLKDANHKLQ